MQPPLNIIINDYSKDAVVLGDPKLLIEALSKIIINGIEAIEEANPEQPTLELEILQKNSNIIITCTDNGIGIPKEIINNIFLPYFTTKPYSTGLSLSIASFIIENKFHGSISVASTKGRTRFTIIINT